mmetsp:Transcript_106373/g.339467  ORF Transcript_106373/g.339467 Transcript_106373/m.339467 type:complete len:532 (+) Transcript_106373:35-1630(+)
MFRRICGNVGALSSSEQVAVQDLMVGRSELLPAQDGTGAFDVKSDDGYAACTNFLARIEAASQALGVEIGPRGYRVKFSANYRALFPDHNRHYRVDVLEASVDQQEIWVNSERYELSPEAIEQAQRLQSSWLDIVVVLDRWNSAAATTREGRGACATAPRPEKFELTTALFVFDTAWAHFEERYISELIAVEEKARQLVVRPVALEAQLLASELAPATPEAAALEQQLVLHIAQLNAVANFKRKGRDDLGCDILDAARAELRVTPSTSGCGREAARVLAGDVIASYKAMRGYFRKVGQCIEHVDPHLCNNAGLVARLVDWEETWELGARYVKSKPLLDAVCDTVDEIKAAQRLAPELTAMIEDCDVELFMVLPRLVVLCFLDKPLRERTALVRSLLPHRFAPLVEGDSKALTLDIELKAVYDRFKETMAMLTASPPSGFSGSSWAARHGAWEAIVRQAVVGEEAQAPQACFESTAAAAERNKAIADLLNGVERWSLELQRHCPEDWNQCSAVLVHCLTSGSHKEPVGKFQV